MRKRLLARLKTFSKIELVFISALLLFGVLAVSAYATSYLTGYSWSANTGWIRGSNCTDPNNKSTCSKVLYNVIVSDAGAISGSAWSSNLGWISFDSSATGSSASVDFAHPNANGTYPVKGWARACSVLGSDCSGGVIENESRGNWDGMISLSGTATNGSSYGAVVNSAKTTMTGYAWGGDVVGWVQMNFAVKPEKKPECSDTVDNADTEDALADAADPGCHTDGNAGNPSSYDPLDPDESNGSAVAITSFGAVCVETGKTHPSFTWDTKNANSCRIYKTSDSKSVCAAASVDPSKCDEVVTSSKLSGTLQGGAYYEVSTLPFSVSPTNYTMTCYGEWGPDATKSVSVSRCSDDTTCPAGQHKDADGKCVNDGDDNPGGDDDGGTDDKPQCSDGIDNDGDGKADYPEDPGCSSPNDDNEFNAIYDEH